MRCLCTAHNYFYFKADILMMKILRRKHGILSFNGTFIYNDDSVAVKEKKFADFFKRCHTMYELFNVKSYVFNHLKYDSFIKNENDLKLLKYDNEFYDVFVNSMIVEKVERNDGRALKSFDKQNCSLDVVVRCCQQVIDLRRVTRRRKPATGITTGGINDLSNKSYTTDGISYCVNRYKVKHGNIYRFDVDVVNGVFGVCRDNIIGKIDHYIRSGYYDIYFDTIEFTRIIRSVVIVPKKM